MSLAPPTTAARRATAKISKDVIARLMGQLRPQRKWLITGCVTGALSNLIRLGVAPLVHWLVRYAEKLKGTGDYTPVFVGSGLILGMFLIRGALVFVQAYLMQSGIERATMELRGRVFQHLLRMPHALFDRRRTGELMSLLTSDVPVAQGNVAAILNQAVSVPVTVIAGVAYLFVLNWQLSLVMLFAIPLLAYLLRSAARKKVVAQAKVQQSISEISASIQERIAGARTLKAFGAEEYEAERYGRLNMSAFRAVMKNAMVAAAVPAVLEVLTSLALVGLIAYSAYTIINGSGKLDLGGLLAATLVLERIAVSARQAGQITMHLSQASAAGTRLFTFLDDQPAIDDAPSARVLERVRGDIHFDHVTFGYDPDRTVLNDFSLHIPAGKVVALVGRSGAGKSTLMALIPRFYDVQSGAVRVDETDVREVTLHSLRAQIAIVPQDVHLFSGTVAENIAYGRLDAAPEEIHAAAREARAHDFIMGLPEGYDTPIGERGVRLSGGQRQRLAIARALLRDPRILLLDEATASLDSESEALVQEALQRLMQGRTTLVIAHRLSTVRDADEILVMDEGQLVERGTHQDLLRSGGLYAQMCETQFRGEATLLA